jgi:tetratricopeptide (TPR) repeat protein
MDVRRFTHYALLIHMFWISLIITLIAAVIIAAVLRRHWKEIRLLDTDTIRAEKERQARERIVEQRLERRLQIALHPLQRFGRLIGERAMKTYRNAEERLVHVSSQVQSNMRGWQMPTQEDTSGSVQRLLVEASAYAQEHKWAEAERAYLEILKQNERELEAYRGLGALYLKQRQLDQARETFAFLERVQGADDATYAGMAELAELEQDLPRAEQLRKRAVEKAPKSAMRHAELAQFYLANGSPEYASASAKRACELEPSSAAHLELSVEAAILVRDRASAEKQLERLRLVSTDRERVQVLKEKVDAMK